MTPKGPLYVAFGDHTVAVGGPGEVVDGLARVFAAMRVPDERTPAGVIDIAHDGGEYRVRGNSDVTLEDGSLADVIRCVRFSIIQLLINARADLLWLHAGAAARPAGALLCPGARGQGKSTLVTGLVGRGWSYLSDDVAAWNPSTGDVLPFPVAPAVRDYPGKTMPEWWLREPVKRDVPVPPEAVTMGAVKTRGVVVFGEGSGEPPGESLVALQLLASAWSNAHDAQVIAWAAALAGTVPARWLGASGEQDLAALDRWADEWT